MGRQYRTVRSGGGGGAGAMVITVPSLVTSSSTQISIPSYGMTDISTFTAGDYVMDAPVAGVRKILTSNTSTAAARVIRCATDASVKIGNQLGTQITMNASTVQTCIELIGLNSTQWQVVSVYPVASTGVGLVFGTS